MNTYLMRFETKPAMASDNFGKFAGCYWTVWVCSDSQDAAIQRAIDYAANQGWEFYKERDIYLATRDAHLGDPLLLQRFDEAQIAGIAAILDTFKTRIVETN